MKFINIYKNLLSETVDYYDPKFIGQSIKVKDKVPKKLAAIAGKTLVMIDKPANKSGVVFVAGSAAHAKAGYAKDEDGVVYELFNIPPQPFTIAAKGGKEVKLGAIGTAVQESAVCHFLALSLKSKWKSPSEILNYITNTNSTDIVEALQSCQDRYQTTNVANESVSLVKENKSWAESIASTCSRLIKEFRFSSNAIFHRGSTLSNSIDSKGLELCNKAGAGFGNKKDRWNPSDIWVIDSNSKSITKVLNTTSIQELNGILDNNLEVGNYKDLFGISLKKASYPNTKLKYINMDNTDEPDNIQTNNIETGKSKLKGITKNTDLVDTDNDIKIQLRSAAGNRTTNISGMISGKKAQHGSITIKNLFKHNKAEVPKLATKPDYYFEEDGSSTDKFYSELQTLINEVIMNSKRIGVKKLIGHIFTIKNKVDLDKFMIATLKKHNNNFEKATATIHSKLQGLYLAAIMKQDTLEVAYYTASAMDSFNPKFVKVGE